MRMMSLMNVASNVQNMPRYETGSRISINIFGSNCKKCGPTRIEPKCSGVTVCHSHLKFEMLLVFLHNKSLSWEGPLSFL
jgi:hypothetical protein